MIDVPNDPSTPQDDPKHDPLERFLRDARPEAPEGLADRLLAAATDPEVQAKLYWAEAAEAAGRALRLSAAGLFISAGALLFSYRPPALPSGPTVASTETKKTSTPKTGAKAAEAEKPGAPGEPEVEVVELEAVSDPLELALSTELTRVTSDYPLLGEGR